MTATEQDEEPAPTSGEDAMFRAMFGDLMAEARAGRLTQREFQAACMARMASMPCNANDPRCPDRVDNSAAARDMMRVETDEVVAVLHKSRPDAPLPEISEESFAALNAIISLPPSNPPQRARWPRGIVLDADPVATCKIINDAEGTPAVCLAFDSEDAARVWCWKLNYDVFYGEAAGMPHIQNMDYEGFRLTENMNHFMNYFMQGYLVADAETGKLKLRDGADREGHFEDNQGAGPRQREMLSAWIDRTIKRLTGEVVYQTNPETGPPGTHGPACGCPACLEAVAAAKGIAWSAAE